MPTPTPSAATTAKQPSSAGYWIGGGILVVGCGIAIVWFVVVIVGVVNAPDDFERVAVPGTDVLTLDDGDWTIYYESPYMLGWDYSPPDVTVTGPSGRDVSVGYPESDFTYDVNGRSGQSLYEFNASTPGAYTIVTETVGEPGSRSGDQIAIGRPVFGGAQVGGILGSLALGAASFIVGLVVLIVTIVRRSRAKRVSYPTGYGPGPYGGAPYGPAPYGQPPYGQQPYGQPAYSTPPYSPPGYAPPPAPSAWPPPAAPPPVEPPASQPGWASPQPPEPAEPEPVASESEAPAPAPPPPPPPSVPPAPQPGPPPPGTSPWHPPDDRPPQG
jgi:hypothetical protein